jgi:hypothetical protein
MNILRANHKPGVSYQVRSLYLARDARFSCTPEVRQLRLLLTLRCRLRTAAIGTDKTISQALPNSYLRVST